MGIASCFSPVTAKAAAPGLGGTRNARIDPLRRCTGFDKDKHYGLRAAMRLSQPDLQKLLTTDHPPHPPDATPRPPKRSRHRIAWTLPATPSHPDASSDIASAASTRFALPRMPPLTIPPRAAPDADRSPAANRRNSSSPAPSTHPHKSAPKPATSGYKQATASHSNGSRSKPVSTAPASPPAPPTLTRSPVPDSSPDSAEAAKTPRKLRKKRTPPCSSRRSI